MELGEKLRQARLEAGLTQRQLCGDQITRNMLSLIENGSAKPSMETLRYLASRLGKSVSFFLDETAVVSVNQETMESARRLYDAGDYAAAALVLEGYRELDGVYDREKQLLWALTHLNLAEQAIRQRARPGADAAGRAGGAERLPGDGARSGAHHGDARARRQRRGAHLYRARARGQAAALRTRNAA